MHAWFCRWLPIVFGCHRRADRSFFVRGRQLPLCARCTGELAGILCCVPVCFFWRLPVWVCVLLLVPMVTDGLVQRFTAYESTNLRRVVTGFLFGWGLYTFFAASTAAVFRLGYHLMA